MKIHMAWPHIKRVRWGRVILALFVFLAADVAIQLTLPSDRTSSNARLASIDVVAMSEEQIDDILTSIEDSSYMYLRAEDELYVRSLSELGISIDRDLLRDKTIYSLKDKLIPFSAVGRYFNSELPLDYVHDEQKARDFIEEIAPYSEIEALPAGLISEDGKVGVSPDTPGVRIDIEASLERVIDQEIINRVEVELVAEPYRHELSTERAIGLAETAAQAIEQAPDIIGEDGAVISIPRSEMSSWFEIVPNDQDYQLSIVDGVLDDYIGGLTGTLREPAADSLVTLLDNQEITRVSGVSGKTIDRDHARGLLESALLDGQETSSIELRFVDVAPGVTYERTYSNTAGGLSIYLSDILSSVYSVSVIDLDTPSFVAGYNQGQVMVAASTYKMFVAYYAAHEVEAGRRSWSDILPSGRQLDYCYDQMIEISSNSCAIEVKDFLGAGNINNYVKSLGFTTTLFNDSARISAEELTRSLQLLYSGQLMNPANTQHLIWLMMRQIHRSAIPAGVSPAQVADKGGFVNGYNHDTGIVYGNNGDYAVTIMTKYGKSKSDLAWAARQIHDFMEAK